MTRPGRSEPDCEMYHAILSVSDVLTAVDFYVDRLGFWLAFSEGTPPRFAAVNLGKVQLFLERGTPAPGGCALYFIVGNADELCALHESRGVEIVVPPGDRAYGLRDYTALDGAGYRLTFGHRLRPESA